MDVGSIFLPTAVIKEYLMKEVFSREKWCILREKWYVLRGEPSQCAQEPNIAIRKKHILSPVVLHFLSQIKTSVNRCNQKDT